MGWGYYWSFRLLLPVIFCMICGKKIRRLIIVNCPSLVNQPPKPLTSLQCRTGFNQYFIGDWATTTEPEINTTTTEPVLSAEPSEIVLLLLASDTDNDGLTDIEEAVIGTSAAKPDSDSDGFTDAKELFMVTVQCAEQAQLIDDDFVNFFYTDFSTDNFRVLGIKDWTVNSISALKQLRLTIDTGETIKISVVDNFENISVLNWYLQKNPGVALSEIEIIELPPDFTGLMSPDGTRAYLTDQRREKIYVFEYLVDSQDYMFRYPNIFRMLINNFKLGSRPISEIIDLNASSTPSDNNSTST